MWQIEETLRRFFKELENMYGPLDFVALMPSKGDPNLVDILVSADWLPESDKEAASFLVDNVLNRLDKDDLLQISAVIPIRKATYLETSAEQLERIVAQYYDLEKDNDFDTDNAKAKSYDYYSVGWTNWRAVYGSPGA